MSTYTVQDPRKVTTRRLAEMKAKGEKIAMLTAYDYSMARLVDAAGMDVILVGDSAANVMARLCHDTPHHSRRDDNVCLVGGARHPARPRGV